jgi:hypothetical protein
MYKKLTYIKNILDFKFNEKSKYLFFIAQNSKQEYQKIQQHQNIEYYGAIFPQIIYNDKHHEDGMLVFELENNINPFVIKNIQNDILSYETNIQNKQSIITIVDGLSANIQIFLENFYEIIDNHTNIIGGGAGLLTLVQEPVIFDKNGIYQNSALVIALENELGISVGHGWEQLEGPFVATHTDKNILHTIDYKDAFEVYKDIIQKNSNNKFDQNNFFDVAKQFPLGIISNNDEIIVRDPISTINNSLVLVGELDQNSPIAILKGEPSKLIQAAKETAYRANKQKKIKNYAFIVDCISRILYLEDDFINEIKAIKQHTNNKQLFGILTLGEIANTNKSYIEFYNKTCVVGVN